MKRFLGFSLAMLFALMAIALVGGDSGAVAGHGCHGRRAKECHGRRERCHGKRERCHGKRHHRCHGEQAVAECGACEGAASDCGSCGGAAVEGGCAGGGCGGEGVIVSEGAEGVPTEAPAAPAKT